MSENKFSAADFDHLEFPGGLFLRATHNKFKALRGPSNTSVEAETGGNPRSAFAPKR